MSRPVFYRAWLVGDRGRPGHHELIGSLHLGLLDAADFLDAHLPPRNEESTDRSEQYLRPLTDLRQVSVGAVTVARIAASENGIWADRRLSAKFSGPGSTDWRAAQALGQDQGRS